MRRILLITLMSVILLAGCADNTPDETTQTTSNTTVPTENPSWYVENSSIEQQTHGAVQMFALDGTYTDIAIIGDNVLLADNYGATYLAAIDAKTGTPVGNVRIGKDIPLGDGGFQRTYNGLAYYLQEKRQAVIFNAQLQEIQRIDLPEDMTGEPVFAAGGNELFYCTDNEIKALDIDLEITRLVKTLTYQEQSLIGCYFHGELLACSVTDQLGGKYTIYISTKTGQTLAQDDCLHTIYSSADGYLGVRKDGVVQQFIVGNYNEVAQQLHPAQGEAIFPAIAQNGAVGCVAGQDGAVSVSLYNIISGKKTAAITLTGVDVPTAGCADETGVWLLAVDKTTGDQSLYRWETGKCPVAEETVYTSSVYTAQSPDTAGLEQCQDRARDLSNKHGVDIRIWEKAVRNPGEYTLETEYQTEAINACLDQLEQVLEMFPENFLYKSVKNQIRICIVRSISGDLAGTQYWYNSDAYIILTPGADVWTELVGGVGYIVNSHTMGKSPVMDGWNGLNPSEFTYGEPNESHLEGDSRAFADLQSMQSVADDRGRLFFYAITEGNEEVFRSETMQAKLLMLCQGIRDAWRWEKKSDIYPWEQYLKESIAYQK